MGHHLYRANDTTQGAGPGKGDTWTPPHNSSEPSTIHKSNAFNAMGTNSFSLTPSGERGLGKLVSPCQPGRLGWLAVPWQDLPRYLAGFDGLQVDVGVARGRVDAVLTDVLVGVVWGCLRKVLVDALPGCKGQGLASLPPSSRAPDPAQQDGDIHLSASTSSGGVPAAHRRTIHAASKAARKPLATPVPSGQKGCKGKGRACSWSCMAGRGSWEEAASCQAWLGMKEEAAAGRSWRGWVAVFSPASTAESGEGLGCSSILNQPQISGGAGEGDNLPKTCHYWESAQGWGALGN